MLLLLLLLRAITLVLSVTGNRFSSYYQQGCDQQHLYARPRSHLVCAYIVRMCTCFVLAAVLHTLSLTVHIVLRLQCFPRGHFLCKTC